MSKRFLILAVIVLWPTLVVGQQPVTVAGTATVTATNLDVQSGGADLATSTQGAAIQTAIEILDNIVSGSGVNVSQINGVAVSMGVGASGTGTQRVASLIHDGTDTALVNGDNGGSLQVSDSAGGVYLPLIAAAAVAEDQPFSNGGTGLVIHCVRTDSLAGSSDTDGDVEPCKTAATGAIWTVDANSAAQTTALQLIDNAVSGSGFNITQLGGAAIPMTTTQADNLSNTLDSLNTTGFTYVYDGTTWDRWTGAVTNAGLTELAAAINSNLVDVNIVSGAGSGGTAVADDADFTAGTTSFTPTGGFYQSSVTACTDGDTCAVGITAQRTMKMTPFSSAGAELTLSEDWTVGTAIGTTAPGGVATYADFDGSALPTITNVDTEGEAVPIAASLKGVQYMMLVSEDGSLQYGTSTTPLVVDLGTNNDVTVTGSVTANAGTNLNTSALLTTSAHDAALGTAGSADTQVRTVQGIASMTPLLVNPGTATTFGIYVEDAPETAGANLSLAGSVRRDTAASSATTAGDNATINTDALGLAWTRQLDPCSGVAKTYIPIDIVTATTTEITPSLAGASNHYYVCSINLGPTAGAQNVALVDDDSDNCASVTSGVAGGTTAGEGWNAAANGGLAFGNGGSSIARTNGTNRVLCLVTSAAVQVSGVITVVAAP